MPKTLHLIYETPGDLAAHLRQAEEHQALMIALPPGEEPPRQFDRFTLALHIGVQGSGEVEVEVLQMLGAAGLVLRVIDKGTATALGRWAEPSGEPAPPTVSWRAPPGWEEAVEVVGAADPLDEIIEEDDGSASAGEDDGHSDDEDEDDDDDDDDDDDEEEEAAPHKTVVKGHVLPKGLSPRSWPIEKLRAEWDTIKQPQRIQVARLGKKPARRMIARLNEKQLTHFLLLNPQITVDEVATLANNPSLDPELVRRIANASEWTRHPSIARALICHPRLSMPLITRLVERLSTTELRRLARSGRLRASVKRIVIKKLDRSRQ